MPNQFDLKVKILGDRSLIPEDIMESILRLEKMTENNKSGLLNICFPYTSRDDIKQAVVRVAQQVENKTIDVNDIDIRILEKEMYTGESPDLDLMLRTSGATRFSDFMIWQSCDNCQVEFIDTLWPALTKSDMIKVLLRWGFNETRKLKSAEIMQAKRRVLSKKPPMISVTEVDRSAQAAAVASAQVAAV